MKFEICKKIVAQASKCHNKHACLSDQRAMCKSENNISDIIFVKFKESEKCKYNHEFGRTMVCHCPVRKEIHKRYKI